MRLLFLRGGVMDFMGLSRFPRALHLPGELFYFLHQALVGETKCLHLIRVDFTVSNAPARGQLSTPLGWSCILEGLA